MTVTSTSHRRYTDDTPTIHRQSTLQVAYGLTSFPFLIFHFPVIGPALSSPYPTGYNTIGLLCPLLAASEIKRKVATSPRPSPLTISSAVRQLPPHCHLCQPHPSAAIRCHPLSPTTPRTCGIASLSHPNRSQPVGLHPSRIPTAHNSLYLQTSRPISEISRHLQDELVLELAEKERGVSKIQGAWRESRSRRWVKVTISTLDSPCFRPSELL